MLTANKAENPFPFFSVIFFSCESISHQKNRMTGLKAGVLYTSVKRGEVVAFQVVPSYLEEQVHKSKNEEGETQHSVLVWPTEVLFPIPDEEN